MDRRRFEQITASLSVFLLFFLTIGAILFAADQFFDWDIFPPAIEKVIGFVLLSCFLVIVSSVLVNVMLNVSIIAINSELLLQRNQEHTRDKRSKKD